MTLTKESPIELPFIRESILFFLLYFEAAIRQGQHQQGSSAVWDQFLRGSMQDAALLARQTQQHQQQQKQQLSLSSLATSRPILFDRLTQQPPQQPPRTASSAAATGGVRHAFDSLARMADLPRSTSTQAAESSSSVTHHGLTSADLASLLGRVPASSHNPDYRPALNRSSFGNMSFHQRMVAGLTSTTADADRALLREAAALQDQQQQSRFLRGLEQAQQEAALLQALRDRSSMASNLHSLVSAPAPTYVSSSYFGRDALSASTAPGMKQQQQRHCGMPTQERAAFCKPVTLALSGDERKLSEQQVFLRHQIEAFRAGEDDVSTHTRGRNKPIALGQVGIRCRFCAHLPVVKKQKGSTYFPANLLGLYQAAQNMSTTHMQSGLCRDMPTEIKEKFASLSTMKVSSSGAGRPYWAEAAKQIGLVDTEDGIRFVHDLR